MNVIVGCCLLIAYFSFTVHTFGPVLVEWTKLRTREVAAPERIVFELESVVVLMKKEKVS